MKERFKRLFHAMGMIQPIPQRVEASQPLLECICSKNSQSPHGFGSLAMGMELVARPRATALASMAVDQAAFMAAVPVVDHFRCWYRIQLRSFDVMNRVGIQKRPIRK